MSCHKCSCFRVLTVVTCLLQAPSPATGFVVHSNITPRSRPLLRPRDASTSKIALADTECRRLAILGETQPPLSKVSLFSTKAEVSADVQQVGTPVRSAAEAKRDLLGLLSSPVTDPDDVPTHTALMAYQLENLEAGYIPIQTIPFFNLASKGKWHLAYSNAPVQPLGPRLETPELFQEVNPDEGKKGNFTNVLVWHVIDEGITGRLEVACSYELDPRGRMIASLTGHRLLPDGKMPRDVEWLVKRLQQAMPFELFDPNQLALETSYLDDSLRIVRMEGRLNIFLRDVSVLASSSPAVTSQEGTKGAPSTAHAESGSAPKETPADDGAIPQ